MAPRPACTNPRRAPAIRSPRPSWSDIHAPLLDLAHDALHEGRTSHGDDGGARNIDRHAAEHRGRGLVLEPARCQAANRLPSAVATNHSPIIWLIRLRGDSL